MRIGDDQIEALAITGIPSHAGDAVSGFWGPANIN